MNMNEESRVEFRIPECNLSKLQERIEKLAKRAAKLHFAPPQVAIVSHEDVQLVRDFENSGIREIHGRMPLPSEVAVGYRRYYQIRLNGEAPVIPGYKLVAVIEHGDTDIGNVIRTVPGMDCPVRYRQATALCQHCGFTRRRLETFVLLSPGGEYKQIGRNCLADFCRSPEAAASLCAFAEIIESARGLCCGSEDGDFFGYGGRTAERVPTEAVLAMTARIIRHCGWTSKKSAQEDYSKTATAFIIDNIFFNHDFFKVRDRESWETKALRDAAQDITAADEDLAGEAIEWIRSMRDKSAELSDYLYNCLVIASEETVLRKHFGILCSIVASYQRNKERVEAAKVNGQSEHFGTIKNRGRWFGKYLGSKSFETETYGYGDSAVRYLHRFAVGANIAIWWTGTELELDNGQEVIIVGSIKSHEEYKGKKQTVLTRCDVVAELAKCVCGGPLLAKDKKCPVCKAKIVHAVV